MSLIHPDAQANSAATPVPEMRHDLLHVGIDRRSGEDSFVPDDFAAILVCIHRKEMVPVSEVVDKCNSRNTELRHSGRHDEFAHFGNPLSRNFHLPAHDHAGAFCAASTRTVSGLFSLSCAYSCGVVNDPGRAS